MSGFGPFVYGVARLSKHGDVSYQGTVPESFADYYTVVFADPSTRATLENVSGLPKIGSESATVTTGHKKLRVEKITFSQLASDSRVWTAKVEYGLGGSDVLTPEAEETDPPAFRNVRVHWGLSEDSADIVSDVRSNGRPLVNSAGDPFDSVPQKRTFGMEIRITFDADVFPAVDYMKNGYVNSADFTFAKVTFPRHCAMLHVEVDHSNDATFPYSCIYTITQRVNAIARPESGRDSYVPVVEDIGWDVAFAECGFQFLEQDGSDWIKRKFTIPDADGNLREPSVPLPLDESGRPREYPAIRIVEVYPETDFSALGIPNWEPEPEEVEEEEEEEP